MSTPHKPTIHDHIPLLESIFDDWKDALGDAFQPYRNHVYRVINFSLALHDCVDYDMEKLVIAGCFHDLGIWTAHTIDYLPPSIDLALSHLERLHHPEWSEEIALMIDMHHKFTASKTGNYPLVEVFRKADWIDVSKGHRSFGLRKRQIQPVLEAFPNLGFHKMLIGLARARFLRHPLKPLPMMKW